MQNLNVLKNKCQKIHYKSSEYTQMYKTNPHTLYVSVTGNDILEIFRSHTNVYFYLFLYIKS